ncbi:hypothetical protein BKA67DRAFT_226789 [Truncatella angustata]|uniref:DUF4048 domain-containing protein n=1 Tax=Truncatella angustata TaxID=152316 RepID=A0A9P8UNB3_9PEZI|nr:uncharacterized protein BKA67DRAFT_226789 [Truncatella angustata]KAH6655121.1 hypothetical protein BKA67DRAFT_226789 [Truncatella angustata]
MSSGQHMQICLITSISNTLLNDYRHLNGLARTVSARRYNLWRPRHRRACSVPSTPFKRRRRPRGPAANQLVAVSARRALHSFPRPFTAALMASSEVRRRGASIKTTSIDAMLAETSSNAGGSTIVCDDQHSDIASMPPPRVGRSDSSSKDSQSDFTLQPWRSSAPPVSSASETFETRSTRSSSTASRNANRLSLTLPVAPANSMPSRPTPTSIPPTPTETIGSTMASPVDPNDFIVAIAAQERRVLELREELSRAEAELKTLKTRWNSSEAHKIRTTIRKREPVRPVPTGADALGASDSPTNRRSLDIERKKALLLANGTPREFKRRVMRGGHTRTLSLLSPTKSEHDISIHNDVDTLRSPDALRSSPDFPPVHLTKRATWAPRQSSPPNGVKQIAQDFRQGLWTFVEDLRQATVGDEGISATSNRTSEFPAKPNRANSDQDTIRPSNANRGRIPFATDSESQMEIPRKASPGSFQDRASQNQRTQSKPDYKARKHFSWTPLTFDDLGDDDWSNWDSPSIKTSRWSGSTVNGDIIPAVPEKVVENEATLKKRSSSDLRSPSPQTPGKLGEIPSALLNSLTPSNIKRFSSDFIKEWERSLSPPADSSTFEPSWESIKDKAH